MSLPQRRRGATQAGAFGQGLGSARMRQFNGRPLSPTYVYIYTHIYMNIAEILNVYMYMFSGMQPCLAMIIGIEMLEIWALELAVC